MTTILSLLFVWLSVKLGWVVYYGYNRYLLNDSTEWLIHIGTLSLFLIVAHVSIRAIKNYLTSNIAELESSIDKVYKLAYFDQLTGIPNRFMFNESLLKRTEIHHVNGYLVLFDLKGFKLINSLHGNELGDEILIKIAQVFNELKGDREMVARISGNEYAWWMEGLVGKTLNYRLEYLKEQFYIRLRSLGIDKKIEFHVSYAHFPTNGGTIDKVYQKATMALEYAKTIKHVNVVSYNQTLEQITRDEEALKEMLLRDIENEAFHLAFQEKVYVKTGKVLGLEVLARWQTQTRGAITPSVFIPIVEKASLSIAFGNMIIKKALDAYPNLQEEYGGDIMMSINISPSHLMSKGFKVYVMEEISRRNIRQIELFLR